MVYPPWPPSFAAILKSDPPVDLNRERVNIAQACAIAGVSRRTIYYWLQSNKVEWVRTAGGPIRIYADTLLRRPPPS